MNTIREIYFVNEMEGWAIGDYQEPGWYSGYGIILHTIDGGYTWEMQYGCPSMDETILEIDFIDNQNGWTDGKSMQLHRTTDGGISWDTLNTGYSSLTCFDYINSHEGWYNLYCCLVMSQSK